MAIYSSTLIIKDNLNYTDAELIKLLNLDIPVTGYDTHQITKENIKYNDVIHSLSSDKNGVFVSSKNNFTIIVSYNLISDFSVSNSLLKKNIEKVFSESEYFLFFSETTSMLNGYIWYKNKEVLRRKYVQNGDYIIGNDELTDFGVLLPEEKILYNNSIELVNGYPIKNKDYMWGASDFNIASSFLEREFQIKSLDKFLSNLNLNKNIFTELTPEYIDSINNKLTKNEVLPAIKNHLKPLMQELKYKLINFQEKEQSKKSIGYYKNINDHKRIVIEILITSFRFVNHVLIRIYIKDSSTLFNKISELTSFNGQGLGIDIYSINAKFVLNKLKAGTKESIKSRSDLTYFISQINLEEIKSVLEKASTSTIKEFFDNKEYYKSSIEKLKEIKIVNKKFPSPDSELKFCLIHYIIKNEKKSSKKKSLSSYISQILKDEPKEIKKEILEIINFRSEDEHLSHLHNETILLSKNILNA